MNESEARNENEEREDNLMPEEREGQTKHIEREFEIGKDESWFVNNKRLADEMLGDSLSETRRNRHHFDRMVTNAISKDDERASISNNALNQAVHNTGLLANMGLTLLGAGCDRIINIDEVSNLAAKTGVQADAIASIVVAKLTEALLKQGGSPGTSAA